MGYVPRVIQIVRADQFEMVLDKYVWVIITGKIEHEKVEMVLLDI